MSAGYPEGFTEENVDLLYKTLEYTSFFSGNEKEFKAITKRETIDDAYQDLLGISTSGLGSYFSGASKEITAVQLFREMELRKDPL